MIPLELRRRIMLTGNELEEYGQNEKVSKCLLDCDYLDHRDVKIYRILMKSWSH